MLIETRYLKREILLSEIFRSLGISVKEFDHEKFIDSVSELNSFGNEKSLQLSIKALQGNPAGITFAPLESSDHPNICRLANPKDAFFAIISWLEENIGFECIFQSYIAQTALIHEKATIASSVSIGENCLIGAGVVIYPNVQIGNNCVIEANTVIGNAGFGVIRNASSTIMIPHIGGVKIGDNVRIGALSTIDKGTLRTTSIGAFTRIDDKVHVSHNCDIGSRNIICAGVNIAGSVVTGNDVWLGLGCNVKQKIKIEDGATIGIGANVFQDITKNKSMFGYPAKRLP